MGRLMIEEVQVLHNKAARMVYNATPRSNRTEMFVKLGWLTFNQLILYNTLVSIFKVRKFKEPEYLSSHSNEVSRTGRIK